MIFDEAQFFSKEADLKKIKRSKDELLNDIIETVNSGLTITGKYDSIDEAIWKWTEIYGKIVGCPYWSLNAFEWYTSPKETRGKIELIHEHVVPRKFLIRRILSSFGDLSREESLFLLDKYALGCVVTKIEDIML